MAVAWYKSITPHSVHINWHQLKSHTLDNAVDWSGMDTSPFDAYAEPHIHGNLLNLFIDHTSLMQFPLYFRSGKNELFSNYFVLCRTFNALGIHFDIYTLVCCYHSTHIQPIHTTCTISIDIPALNNTENRICVVIDLVFVLWRITWSIAIFRHHYVWFIEADVARQIDYGAHTLR